MRRSRAGRGEQDAVWSPSPRGPSEADRSQGSLPRAWCLGVREIPGESCSGLDSGGGGSGWSPGSHLTDREMGSERKGDSAQVRRSHLLLEETGWASGLGQHTHLPHDRQLHGAPGVGSPVHQAGQEVSEQSPCHCGREEGELEVGGREHLPARSPPQLRKSLAHSCQRAPFSPWDTLLPVNGATVCALSLIVPRERWGLTGQVSLEEYTGSACRPFPLGACWPPSLGPTVAPLFSSATGR